jgi:siroheme synthase-like protein
MGNRFDRGYYPVSLKVKGRKCLVVGGGPIAWRKVRTLLDYGVSVTVVSPSLCPELVQLLERKMICVMLKNFSPEDINGYFMIIAATDQNEINEQVASAAQIANVLVNVVDNAMQSTFIFPAVLSRGDLTIAVSTSGKSPALSRKLRDQLEQRFSDDYCDLTSLLAEVRAETKAKNISISGDTWQKALDIDKLINFLRNGQRGTAKSFLISRLTKNEDL